MKVDGEVADIALEVQAIDQGVKTTVVHIDKDLEALDQHINCCRQECEQTEASLRVAKGKIEVLEECSNSQCQPIERLLAKVEVMEGKLCQCGQKTEETGQGDTSSLLGSPLDLNHPLMDDYDSANSYHTPPLAGSSIPSLPSSSVANSNKENVNPGLGCKFPLHLIEILEDPLENVEAIPIPALVLDVDSICCLFTVRGQRAVRTLGRPKTYHPYTNCCSVGCRSSTHHAGSVCSRSGIDGRESSSAGGIGESG